MTEASTSRLLVDAEHLGAVTTQSVHFVGRSHDGDAIAATARAAASQLGYHLAPLDGRAIRTEQELLRSVCRAFELPGWMQAREELGWHAVEDLMWDLPSVFQPPHEKKGVAVLLRDPEPLLRADLLLSVLFLDTLISGLAWQLRQGSPLHVVIGPLPEDPRYEVLLSKLTVAKHFCRACWANATGRARDE